MTPLEFVNGIPDDVHGPGFAADSLRIDDAL
jgi:hypothetical protein